MPSLDIFGATGSGLSGSSSSGSSVWGDLGLSNIGMPSGSNIQAAGSVIAGIGDFMAGAATGHKLKDAARRVENMTALRLDQFDEQGYLFQGRAMAAIGANGGTLSGSAAEILRNNTTQLALAHGLIQAQGSEQAAELRARASASFMSGWGGLISGVVTGAAKAAGG